MSSLLSPLALQLLLAPTGGTDSSSTTMMSQQQQHPHLDSQIPPQLAAALASDAPSSTTQGRPGSPSTADSLKALGHQPSSGLSQQQQHWGSVGPSSASQQHPQHVVQVDHHLERAVSTLAQELAALAAASGSPAAGGAGLQLADTGVTLGLDLSGLAASASTSKSLQPKLLKQINSLTTKEEILNYIEHCHHLLDSINLVTCLYRLARIYSFTQSLEQKAIWKAELVRNPSFALLLSVVHGHLARAQAILATQADVPGLNARCMSNLVWSIVKLEVVGADDGHPLALEVALASVPLVLCFIKDCSGQGLANLLWSFVKIPNSPPQVITVIVERMVELLEQPASSATLDAQALSNTIWAIAHVRSSPSTVLDNSPEWNNAVTSFLLLMANQCMQLLTTSLETGHRRPMQAMGGGQNREQNSDGRFSCQAIVNIVWSFSTILGSACGVQAPMRPLFLVIRQLAVARLQVMVSGNSTYQPLAMGLTGSFNEQALSNLVFAYNKAGLLSPELLQAVFDVAALRLGRTSAGAAGPLGFKPQELCTLLRACHLGIAQPWTFLHALSRVMAQYPTLTTTWTTAELGELHQALQLLRSAMPIMQGQQQQQAPQHQQQQLHGGLGALSLGGGGSSSSIGSLSSHPRPRQHIMLAQGAGGGSGGGGGGASSAPHVGGGAMAHMGVHMHSQGLMMPSASSGLSMGSGSSASPQPSMMHHHHHQHHQHHAHNMSNLGGGSGLAASAPHLMHHPSAGLPGGGIGGQVLPSGLYQAAPGGGVPPSWSGQLSNMSVPSAAPLHDATQAGVLQQIWMVDAAGNLQPTTLILPAGNLASVQDSLQHLSLGNQATLLRNGGSMGSGNHTVPIAPQGPH